ncbi:MAG: hypothetical protein UW60_C0003G0001, partial [Candidatus Woesebacteria bacterium GW2011_GWA2_44_33]
PSCLGEKSIMWPRKRQPVDGAGIQNNPGLLWFEYETRNDDIIVSLGGGVGMVY